MSAATPRVPRRLNSALVAGLLVLGALLYALHVRVPRVGWIAFVSTGPWVFVLVRCRGWGYRRVALTFGAILYLLCLISTPWLRSFTALGWVIAPLFYLPFFMLAPLATHLVLRRAPRIPVVLIWPLAFTAAEWIRIRASAGEVPLLQLGVGLVSVPWLVQIVDLTGVAGLTLLACLTAALAAVAADSVLGSRDVPSLGRLAAAVAGVLTLALVYGRVRLSQADFRPGPEVLVIQNNFHGWLDPADAARQQAELIRLTRLHASPRGIDLVAWPENTVTNLDAADPQLKRVEELARDLQVPILVDGPSGMGTRVVHHAAALVGGDKAWVRYEKVVLVPWSESLPFASTLSHVSPGLAGAFTNLVRTANPRLVEMTAGRRARTLPLLGRDGRRYDVATPICYESLSPRLMASFFHGRTPGSAGAFVVNPVSERLLGPEIHEQTLALTRLRAIENRVTIVRASNNGISAAIDPNGHPYAWVPGPRGGYGVDVQGFFVANVVLDGRFGTPYSRWGDWLPVACLLGLAGMVVLGGRRKRHTAGSPPPAATAEPM